MTFAVIAVQRARTPFMVHVLDVAQDVRLPIPSGRDTAFVALLGTFSCAEQAERAREHVRDAGSIAGAMERLNGSGYAVVVAECVGALCALTLLRSRGSPLPVASNTRMTTVAVLTVRPTQPGAAVALNRIRSAGAQTIAAARAVLELAEPRVAAA